MATREMHLVAPEHNEIAPGGCRHGGKIGPKNVPRAWVPKRGWRLAVLRGVAVVWGGQRHLLRCAPFHLGIVKWGL